MTANPWTRPLLRCGKVVPVGPRKKINLKIRKLYVKNLKRSKIVDTSYEGLGLIDIISESTDKIDFHFRKVNETDTFFSINVQI